MEKWHYETPGEMAKDGRRERIIRYLRKVGNIFYTYLLFKKRKELSGQPNNYVLYCSKTIVCNEIIL